MLWFSPTGSQATKSTGGLAGLFDHRPPTTSQKNFHHPRVGTLHRRGAVWPRRRRRRSTAARKSARRSPLATPHTGTHRRRSQPRWYAHEAALCGRGGWCGPGLSRPRSAMIAWKPGPELRPVVTPPARRTALPPARRTPRPTAEEAARREAWSESRRARGGEMLGRPPCLRAKQRRRARGRPRFSPPRRPHVSRRGAWRSAAAPPRRRRALLPRCLRRPSRRP